MKPGLARKRAVVETLQSTAQRTQRDIRAFLERQKAAGHVSEYLPFWVFNGLAVTGDAQTLYALAARPDVAKIRANHVRRLPKPGFTADEEPAQAPVVWNVERIGAPRVWEELGVTGKGVVVGSMDTGVQWNHPALINQYRGADGDHNYDWFDFTGTYDDAPGDGYGHGTHTLGTAVGRGDENRIGVAPDAQWIAVKVFTDDGMATDVDLHKGFQWMLAPTDLNGQNPDPSKAPDVVNDSWGSGYPDADPSFWPDVAAWRAAGIFPSFSAGNEGALGDGSVSTPGAFPISFSAGATDADERIADFSSRGPSFWDEIKPDVSAPGVNVRSSLPTDSYGVGSGTSMAVPHVSGLVALLLDANPNLTVDDLEEFIRRTAVDLGDEGPDNAYGWGRIDAYRAVRWALSAGQLNGAVRDAEAGGPVAGATVAGQPASPSADAFITRTDARGVYTVSVPSGVYTVTVSAFGYLQASVSGIEVVTGFLSVYDVSLKPAPTGRLTGRVAEARTGQPLMATVSVPGTPAEVTTDRDGRYTIELPAGSHDVAFAAPGHGRVIQQVSIAEGGLHSLDVELEPVPSILLVDADTWVGTNQTLYYRRALDELGYPYDVHLIADATTDVPTAQQLAAYDIVIWVHPWSSPGYIDARVRQDTTTVDALRGYLDSGGRLLIIGQDIGYWDSAQQEGLAPGFYSDYLHAVYREDDAGSRTVIGLPNAFLDGIELHLEDVYGYKWGDELAPDVIEPASTQAAPLMGYQTNDIAGLQVTTESHRLVYLAFGLEGAGPRPTFTETISRTLAWLGQPSLIKTVDQSLAMPGSTLTYTLQVRNAVGLELRGATLIDRLPPEVSFVPGSLTGGATYDPSAKAVRWSGDLAPRQTLTITFQATVVSPLAGGTVITNQATLDDGRGNLVTATATTTVLGPDLSASSKTVSHAVADPGDVLTYTLALTNLAAAPVPGVQLVDPIPPGTRYVEGSVTGGATYNPTADRIEWTGTVPGHVPYTPEYTWQDSDTPGGPTFEWVDISTTGTLVEELGDDTNVGPFDIGFSFPFYGQTFTSFRVCSNGWLSFSSISTSYLNRDLPDASAPGNLIAPFWDDLTLTTGGRVLYWTNNSDTLVVTYEGVQHFGNTGPYTFQVILRADGSITYQYLSMGEPTDSATIGIQNADGSQGLTIAHNEVYVHAGLAILISPPAPPPVPPSFTFQVQLDPGLPGHSVVDNRAVVTDSAGVSYVLSARTLVHPANLRDSRLIAEPETTTPGGVVTYTILLRNTSDQLAPTVVVSNELPVEMDLVPGSLTAGAEYDPATRLVTWSGPVPPQGEVPISFAAQIKPTVPTGTTIVSVATVNDGLDAFTIVAFVEVGLPDLSLSRKVVDRAVARSGDELQYTISLTNTGQVDALGVTLTDPLPEGTTYVPGSVTGGATYDPATNAIVWRGDVPARGVYTWRDSFRPGGPAFEWVDITTIGTEITGLGDDTNVGPLPIGFQFPFYGQRFSEFYFSTNGFLSFNPISGGNYSNKRLPDPTAPGNMLAIFWDDLDFRQQGHAYYWSNGIDTLVVSYVGVPHLSSGGPYTFQVILKADGSITYQYLAMVSRLQEATIGIQNADGSEGITVAYNEPYVADHLALGFLPPRWQTVTFRARVQPDLPLESVIINTAMVDLPTGPLTLSATTLVNTVDLSTSRLNVSQAVARPGDELTYTMRVVNDGVVATEAHVSIPVPDGTTYVPGSVSGAVYDAAMNQVTWVGTVARGEEYTFSFVVVTDPSLANGVVIAATATVDDGVHPAFTRKAETRIAAPDFSGSEKIADRAMADPGDVIHYTVIVENSGDAEGTVMVTDMLPANLAYVPDSATAGRGAPPQYDPATHQLTWQGSLPARSRIQLAFACQVTDFGPVVNRVLIDDGRGTVVEKQVRTESSAMVAVIPATRGATGYVTSKDRLANYLGQPQMYAGVDSRPQTPIVFHGVVQFDLSAIPADAVIVDARVELTGLDDKFLSPNAQGIWNLRLLDSQVDLPWSDLGYWHIHNAPVATTLSPTLADEELGPGQVHVFTFGPDRLAALSERLQTTRRASFRLDGEVARPSVRHIFAWDAQAPPVLHVVYRR